MGTIHIIGGGTVSHVRNHLALTAPAYGGTARQLGQLAYSMGGRNHSVEVHLTKMANSGKGTLETNEDVSKLVDQLIADKQTKIIFFNPALVDFKGSILSETDTATNSGKYQDRLKTSEGEKRMLLSPSDKIVGKIRKQRKDIFLVAFKTTCGATEDDQFLTGLHLLKANSCNLVLANDTKTRTNMIITPEQARYCVTTDREVVLKELVGMALDRSEGTFTRSTVVDGEPVPWESDLIPSSLRAVVDHCVKAGAYKTFNKATVGHFAVKVNAEQFITSKRKVDFNHLKDVGMVLCKAQGENTVLAYGARPSVGGQSQRIIFKDHPNTDCIVHFHCPPKLEASVSIRSQKMFECGSHECGKNTSAGLREDVPGIKCVYLDNHGPNIVFNRNIDPQKVIEFIDKNFDLKQATDQIQR